MDNKQQPKEVSNRNADKRSICEMLNVVAGKCIPAANETDNANEMIALLNAKDSILRLVKKLERI
ncbi:hypothetical protein [Ruegeria sp. Ofav3-42]|uniref:hypothetical protein n=1 Tax=Ruegeria sp. Ofav3-42 TaxID=2917759 RepID=UPI001EF5EAD0|nr:hypothetical protein [Ruegeria sp. Ofav3-42]MCG7521521.1 hypothetical protein [Ruegeria sp. Ofav3-42]